MFVPRSIPNDAIKERLISYDDSGFGMVNLSGDGILSDDELINIRYVNDTIVLAGELKLYFPAYENYMVTTYESESGYTLRDILKLANKVGYIFYDLYSEEKEGDIIGEYALCNYYIKGNNVYFEPDH